MNSSHLPVLIDCLGWSTRLRRAERQGWIWSERWSCVIPFGFFMAGTGGCMAFIFTPCIPAPLTLKQDQKSLFHDQRLNAAKIWKLREGLVDTRTSFYSEGASFLSFMAMAEMKLLKESGSFLASWRPQLTQSSAVTDATDQCPDSGKEESR